MRRSPIRSSAAVSGPVRVRATGFSLVELLVVLVMAGLLISLVGGSVIRNLDGVKVRRASKDLMTALRYTRGQAVVSRAEKTLDVNVEEKSYQAPGRDPVKLPDGVDVTLKTALFDLDGTVGKVRFFPDGSSTGAAITLTAGRRDWEITVAWLTGEIALEKAADG